MRVILWVIHLYLCQHLISIIGISSIISVLFGTFLIGKIFDKAGAKLLNLDYWGRTLGVQNRPFLRKPLFFFIILYIRFSRK